MSCYAVTVELSDKSGRFRKIDYFEGQNKQEAEDKAYDHYGPGLYEGTLERILKVEKVD